MFQPGHRPHCFFLPQTAICIPKTADGSLDIENNSLNYYDMYKQGANVFYDVLLPPGL